MPNDKQIKQLEKLKRIQEADELKRDVMPAALLVESEDMAESLANIEGVLADVDLKDVNLIKGEDGYTPVKGVDYLTDEELEAIKDQSTPVKGVDYFDGIPGYTPVKGVDYFDGEKGDPGVNADEEFIIEQVLAKIPENEDIVFETAEELRDKLESLDGDARLDVKAISGLNKILKDIKKSVKSGGTLPFLGGSQKLKVETEDGVTSNTTDTLLFPNGSLTVNADGSVSVASGGGGGSTTLASTAVGYGDGSNEVTGDATNFSWDATNKRLGIGTSAASYPLDVNVATGGTLIRAKAISSGSANVILDRFSDTSNQLLSLQTGGVEKVVHGLINDATDDWILRRSATLNENSEVRFQESSGFLGLGTGAVGPEAQLHVKSDTPVIAKFSRTSGNNNGVIQFESGIDSMYTGISTNGASNDFWGVGSGSNISSAAHLSIIRSTGSVGINTSQPAHPLDVNGNARFRSAIIDGANTAGTAGQILQTDGSNVNWVDPADGDVVGPASSTDNAVPLFDGTTGKLLQDSGMTFSSNSFNVTGNLSLEPVVGLSDPFEQALHVDGDSVEGVSKSNTNGLLITGYSRPAFEFTKDNTGASWSIVMGSSNKMFIKPNLGQVDGTDADAAISLSTFGQMGIGVANASNFEGLAVNAPSVARSAIVARTNRASQTSPIQRWETSDADVLAVIDKDGQLGIGVGTTVTEAIDVDGNIQATGSIKSIGTEGVVSALGNIGGTEVIDWSAAETFTGTLDADVTITHSNELSGRKIYEFWSYDGVAQRAITHTDVDVWLSDAGSVPTAPSASGHVLKIMKEFVGTTCYATAFTNY